MAGPLDPTDIPLPGLARDPGVKPATAPVKLTPVRDTTGQAMAQVAADTESGLRATSTAQQRFQANMDSVAWTFKAFADERQNAEDKAFLDRYQLEYSKRSAALTAESLSSPDASKPDFVTTLDKKLADAQAEVLKTMRDAGVYSPSQKGIDAANGSALDVRTTTARSAAITAHNQRLGVVVDSATQNILQIGRNAAATGDLEGGVNRTNTAVNSLEGVLAPDKFMALKRTAREQTTEMVVRGYIERGEFDKAKGILDQNRTFVGNEAVVADVARRNGVDPALLVATARVESGGNPVARPGIDPRTGKPYSNASGMFQFIPATGRAYGLPDDAAGASVEEQSRAASSKIKDDTRILKAGLGGRDPTAGQIYMAWVLGPETAVAVLNADPNAPIESLVGAKAVRANPTILAGKTAGDISDWAAIKMVMAGAGAAMPGRPVADNKAALDKALTQAKLPGLTQEEQGLYDRHLKNLYGPDGVTNQDGSRSTLFATSVDVDGKTYMIPTVWGGKVLPADQALERAKKEGLDKFPSYASSQEANDRYSIMHRYMDKDASAYSEGKRTAVNADVSKFLKEDTRVQLLNLAQTQQKQLEERAEKQADKALKRTGEAYLRDIYKRSDENTLSPDYVNEVRHYLSPAEYKGALALTKPGANEDDATAVIDLTGKIDSAPPEEFMRAAVSHMEGGRLKTTTFTGMVEKNRSARKDDAPASPYKVGKSYIEAALDPGLLSGAAQQPLRVAKANATIEYENWIQANPNASRTDALNAATSMASRYMLLNTNQMEIAVGTSRYLGGKTIKAATLPDIDAAERALYADMQAGKLTKAQQETEIRQLKNSRAIVQSRMAKPPVAGAPPPKTPIIAPQDMAPVNPN